MRIPCIPVWIKAMLTAVILVLLVKTFAFTSCTIPSTGMENSLYQGERVLVNKWSYGFRVPFSIWRWLGKTAGKGDIVLFNNPNPRSPQTSVGNREVFISRVVGVPGDTLMLNDELWVTDEQMERFEQKATLLNERLKRCQGNWEDAFFITLARNFGFGLNGDAFETWAHRLPFRAVDKHRNDLFQIEAIFFGQAGILEDSDGDGYYLRLKKEYTYLQHKFGLIPMDASLWRFLRLRPANFPHIRIAQLACLYHRAYGLLSRIMETETLQGVRDILKGGTSEYWLTHYTFGGSSPSRPKTLSNTSLDLLIINTVVTFLYAYGLHKGNRVLCARAGSFLEELKAENNYITRMWEQCGMKASNAADSQALIQLKKEYCDKKKCLYCRIGYEYLKRS